MVEATAPKGAMSLSLTALNATVSNIVELYHAAEVHADNQRAVAQLERILDFLDQAHAVMRERARQLCSSSGESLGEVTSAQDSAAVIPVSLPVDLSHPPCMRQYLVMRWLPDLSIWKGGWRTQNGCPSAHVNG